MLNDKAHIERIRKLKSWMEKKGITRKNLMDAGISYHTAAQWELKGCEPREPYRQIVKSVYADFPI